MTLGPWADWTPSPPQPRTRFPPPTWVVPEDVTGVRQHLIVFLLLQQTLAVVQDRSWKGELAASLIFPLEGCPISTWELTFLGKRVLVTAVRAKAIVRSSVLCSLDELCKTFLLKDTRLKILRKMSTKSGGLPFPQRVKLVGWWEKK